MPTINRYADKSGYYIRARPSNAGNITYKIKKEGDPIVGEYGLRDGDEISWSVIQLFKALKIVYTEESGTLKPDDFKPDPEQLEKTELSKSDAQKLFSIITAQFDISHNERIEIQSILGLPLEIDVEAIGDRIKSYLEAYVDTKGLLVQGNQMIENVEEIDIYTWVEEDDSVDYGAWRLHILIINEVGDESHFTEHCIHLCNKHGLEHWHVQVLDIPTWDIKRVAIEQKSIIFPRLLDELRTAEFDLGDPAKLLAPQVELTGTKSTQ